MAQFDKSLVFVFGARSEWQHRYAILLNIRVFFRNVLHWHISLLEVLLNVLCDECAVALVSIDRH